MKEQVFQAKLISSNSSKVGFLSVTTENLKLSSIKLLLCTIKPPDIDLIDLCWVSLPFTFNNLNDFLDFKGSSSCLIVDALFGIGLKGALRSPFREIVYELNKKESLKISLDVPSGLYDGFHCDSDPYFMSDILLSFACLKQSLLTTHHLFDKIFLLYIGMYSDYSSSFVGKDMIEVLY